MSICLRRYLMGIIIVIGITNMTSFILITMISCIVFEEIANISALVPLMHCKTFIGRCEMTEIAFEVNYVLKWLSETSVFIEQNMVKAWIYTFLLHNSIEHASCINSYSFFQYSKARCWCDDDGNMFFFCRILKRNWENTFRMS